MFADYEYPLAADFIRWLGARAEELDQQPGHAAELLQYLGQQSLFGLGVPSSLGGVPGSSFKDAFQAVMTTARYSLTAGFVLWAQRGVIGFLTRANNDALAERWVPALIRGQLAGAPGLSNLIKHGGGLEPLQLKARAGAQGWHLQGRLPWVSNVQEGKFLLIAAAQINSAQTAVFLLPHDSANLQRSPDFSLHAIQSSATAAIECAQTPLSADLQLASCAFEFIGQVRPQFLALQCALSLGIGMASIQQVLQRRKLPAHLAARAEQLGMGLRRISRQLLEGIESTAWEQSPQGLFQCRVQLAELTTQSALLAMQAEGGACFVQGQRPDTMRRLREALLLPLITPTIAQLS